MVIFPATTEDVPLSLMLEALQNMFARHPEGLHVDGDFARELAAGLSDMVDEARALEAAEAERRELLAIAEDLDLVGRFEVREPAPAAVDNVVPFPQRALPCSSPTGGDAA
ncbi:hypothetical protein GGR16_003238 [Chelatococcus caeni]|uniref:Uncharacterized protein n=1 Tax=Chelatococcus caeni TaxID=1348468 RepID=A0A840BYJ7_9HYPH|nr:hypothetical protein [Chelatococcus caeni]MBB4018204.1 hypothetical protein [Chelatococcus caeni]